MIETIKEEKYLRYSAAKGLTFVRWLGKMEGWFGEFWDEDTYLILEFTEGITKDVFFVHKYRLIEQERVND